MSKSPEGEVKVAKVAFITKRPDEENAEEVVLPSPIARKLENE
jgi:hypothetical protein